MKRSMFNNTFTETGSEHLNGHSPRRRIIIKESAFGDSVKIQGQKQCERQNDGSTSEYYSFRHCRTVTVNTARLPTVTHWSTAVYYH